MNPFLFFFFLLLSLLAFAMADDPPMEPEEHPPMNCVPTSCGHVRNITYPFWVDRQQPSHCGFSSFKLSCNNQTLVLKMSDDSYIVREIFYENQSIVLANAEFVDSPCPVKFLNMSFALTPFNVSSANGGLVFLFGCSAMPNYYKIPCDGDRTGNRTFAYLAGDYYHPDSVSNCKSAIMPVTDYSGEASVKDFARLLSNGFLVNWAVASCEACRESKGQCGYNSEIDNFMCICPDRAYYKSCPASDADKISIGGIKVKRILIGSAVGVGFLLVCLLLALYFYKQRKISSIIFWKKDQNKNKNIEAFLKEYGAFAPKRYSYSDVKKITKSFQEKLGQGGYGTVFKGTISNGHVVAVKILNDSKGDGEEFINEVASIGRTFHVNVVSLLGFCSEGSKRALIYDFMCNGSLEKLLHSEKPKTTLDWEKLYQIAIGIARGLEYLHRGCITRIVHFDIKPHNILLDQDFIPKISDFGLAKLCLKKDSIISIADVRGTIGYIAPEVFSRNFGVVSSKSDVYSYGMMVLEIAGGTKNVNAGVENNSSEAYFPHWIYEHLDHNGDLLAFGVAAESEETARKMILVGLWCIQTIPQNRPPMGRVIEMLEGSVHDLQIPPKPYISSSPLGSLIGTSSIEDICWDDCGSLVHS